MPDIWSRILPSRASAPPLPPTIGGRLIWNVTRLTTLTFNGLRTFNTGTPTVGATAITGPAGNGYLASTIAANADHELLRNLLLNLNATFENDSFQGITRTDNVFSAGAGVRYLVNRNLFLGGSFSYYQRSSTARRGLLYSKHSDAAGWHAVLRRRSLRR